MPWWTVTLPAWLQRQLPEGWTGADLFWAMVIFIVASLIGSLLMVGWVIIRIPADYFVGEKPPLAWRRQHPIIRWPLILFKNLLGLILIGLGVIMSFPGVPGQGLLTVFIGIMLVDFPGKRSCEKWCLSRRGILKAINKIRAKYKREPLLLEAMAPRSEATAEVKPPDGQPGTPG